MPGANINCPCDLKPPARNLVACVRAHSHDDADIYETRRRGYALTHIEVSTAGLLQEASLQSQQRITWLYVHAIAAPATPNTMNGMRQQSNTRNKQR
jgi:hypothetical protein